MIVNREREKQWRQMLAQSFHPRQWFEDDRAETEPTQERPSMWVMRLQADGLWAVGFYAPNREWVPESSGLSKRRAAHRVHWLNGGK